MPKIRVHKGTEKRIKVTKTGKLMHQHAFAGHFLSKRSKSRKRATAVPAEVTGSLAKDIRKSLGA